MNETLELCPAEARDVADIAALLKIYSDRHLLLARDEDNIRAYLRNFTVARRDGKLCGCVALRDFGGRLYEVRSLAVVPELQKCGIGRALVEHCRDCLAASGEPFRLFTLTYQQAFFARLGFSVTDRHAFPEKIWSDCSQCPKHACCDEIAMICAGGVR